MPETLRELFAKQAHISWSGWTRHFFQNLDAPHMGRWMRLMNTPYEELSEEEKDSDREEADKFLAIVLLE
jgi:hypothetical protein